MILDERILVRPGLIHSPEWAQPLVTIERIRSWSQEATLGQTQSHNIDLTSMTRYCLPTRFSVSWALRSSGLSFFSSPWPISSAIASAAACFSRSLSSGLASFFLLSSSSLSPKLNGSWSVTGLGSTFANGCHLLFFPLAPEEGRLMGEADLG